MDDKKITAELQIIKVAVLVILFLVLIIAFDGGYVSKYLARVF